MGWGLILQALMGGMGEKAAAGMTEEQKKVLLDVYGQIQAGNFPKLSAQDLPTSEAGQVTADPALRSAQLAALAKMKETTDSGGMTLADRANQAQAMGTSARQNSAQRQRVLESMAQRGMGGSGAELVANLKNNQDSAEQANEAGLQTAAAAQKRYYDSILSRGKMAGDLRGQDFDQAMQAAKARDVRNQYNNSQAFDAQKYNANLPLQLLDARIRASGGVASFYGQQAQDQRNFYAGLGQAGAAATRGIGGSPTANSSVGGSSGTYSTTTPDSSASSTDPWENIQPADDLSYGY